MKFDDESSELASLANFPQIPRQLIPVAATVAAETGARVHILG